MIWHLSKMFVMLFTSFARSPSTLKSSLGFTVASFIDKNCKKMSKC
jgi:hypothetical protein